MTAPALPSPHLERFERDGYTVLEGFFSRDECDRIVAEIEQTNFRLDLGAKDDGQLEYRPMMHLLSPGLQAVACDERWAPVVLPLVGDDAGARLYWEQAVFKPPHAHTELPWHQDNGYTPLVPEAYLTCWVAFDDADESNGCIHVIPGSHRNGTRSHVNDPGGSPFRVGNVESDEGAVAVPVSAGDVLLFSSLVMHRSGPNMTDGARRAWIIQYCGADALSALSGKALDDRLLLAQNGVWLAEPRRDREFDLVGVLANYDQG
ncbi:MAG: phytanoyl-CoA dioxygenase family protein [Actinomycetia bacterium]|nr:phytanoyl-CoA dioxygenase family protein [Actinomycetes bacterium]